MAAMMAGIAALQLVPGLNVVVNVALLGFTYWNLGRAGLKFIKELIGTAVNIFDATTASSLCAAGGRIGLAFADLAAAAGDVLPFNKLTKFFRKARDKAVDRARANDVDPDEPKRITCEINGGAISRGFAASGGCPTLAGTPNPSNYTKTDTGFVGKDTSNRGDLGPKPYDLYPGSHKHEGVDYQVYKSDDSDYWIFVDGKRMRVRNPNPDPIEKHVVGLIGEKGAAEELRAAGLRPVGQGNQTADNAVERDLGDYRGQKGIDGIYKDSKGNWVIVETKASQSGTAGGLDRTKATGQEQLSKEWLLDRIDEFDMSGPEKRKLKEDILNNRDNVKLLKVEVTGVDVGDLSTNPNPDAIGNGTVKFREVKFKPGDDKSVNVGDAKNTLPTF